MRKADIDVAWRYCREPQRQVLQIDELVVEDPQSALKVASRLVGLVGQNGAGKTGYLQAIRALCAGRVPPPHVALLQISGTFRGNAFSVQESVAAPANLVVDLVDVSKAVHRGLASQTMQTNFGDLVQQAGFRENSADERSRFKYVCQNNYSSIKVAELELPSDGGAAEMEDEIFPYFNVVRDGIAYDNASMGFGELCACYTIWRAGRAEKGSVLLLDEPDSHLSPSSRAALIDVLALIAHELKLWIVFTSHASEHLSVMRPCDLFVVLPSTAASPQRLATANGSHSILKALKLIPNRRCLLLVEDVDAAECLRQIVNLRGDELSPLVEVQVITGGDAVLVDFVERFPPSSRICQAVAVLDGDKRPNYAGQLGICFLPGDQDPVAAARSEVGNPDSFLRLAANLGVSRDALAAAIANVAYVDHHDFCSAIAAELNLDGLRVENVRAALLRTWLDSESVCPQAGLLVDALGDIIDGA